MRSHITAALFAFLALSAVAESVDVTVRRAPYVVSTVSSRTIRAKSACRYCGAELTYDHKDKWDVYNHVWVDVTDKKDIPEVCRKCRELECELEELETQERKLDLKIGTEEAKARVKRKKRLLEKLRGKKK